jgi:surfeit locus 1 family protein
LTRRSLFWPSFWTFLGLILLLWLGTWQVERLSWKESLIAQRQATLTAAPVPLPDTIEAARALEFHPVRASGEFLNDHELYLNQQAADGKAGFQIVTPFRLADGRILLVDRGFVPTDRRSSDTRRDGLITGPTTITGLMRVSDEGKPSYFTPDNEPAKNSWFFIDLPAMAKAAGVDAVLPFYIDADASPVPGGLPQGGQTITDMPNNHLQYAITWYALALGLIVIYILFARRRLREGNPGEPR